MMLKVDSIHSCLWSERDVSGQRKLPSIITNLWKGNSTDLTLLAKDNSDFSNYKNDPKLFEKLDSKISCSDCHLVMSDAGYTDRLNDVQNFVFTKNIGGNGKMIGITGDSLVLGKIFADEYPVMKTNWLGIIDGEIFFITVVAGSIVYFGNKGPTLRHD